MLFLRKKRRSAFRFLVLVAIISIAASVLWQRGVVDAPPIAVHVLRTLAASLTPLPQPSFHLDIPFHRQEHSLSCEIASLRAALLAQGIDVPESDLLRFLPFDQTPKGAGVWGDPNKGFVGNIDGKMFTTGYGVYWDPVAALAQRWKRAEIIRNGTPQELAEHLSAGRPVIVWGYLGRGLHSRWKTPAGETIEAVNGEHTRVAYGFSGSAENPEGFFLVDPIYGHAYWPIEKFLRNWDAFGRSGVVVYPFPRWMRVQGDFRVWEISEDGRSRREVRMPWEEFVRGGGSADAVVVVAPEELRVFPILP